MPIFPRAALHLQRHEPPDRPELPPVETIWATTASASSATRRSRSPAPSPPERVPPVLSPVVLDRPGTFEAVEGATRRRSRLHEAHLSERRRRLRQSRPETVWNRCRTVLVPTRGALLGRNEVETDWVKKSMRALDIATDQSRGLRKRAPTTFTGASGRAPISASTRAVADYGLADAMAAACAALPLATIRTRLNPFSDREQEELVNWGYARRRSIRRFARLVAGQPPRRWPYPCHARPRRLGRKRRGHGRAWVRQSSTAARHRPALYPGQPVLPMSGSPI